MTKLRRKFTKWYIKKGYQFRYEGVSPSSAVWICPWYIRPFLFLFSPSVYMSEICRKYFYKGYMKGLKENINNRFLLNDIEDKNNE